MNKIYINDIFKEAKYLASLSNDPSRGVGCVITDINYYIESMGYNRFPTWFDTQNSDKLTKDVKSNIVLHAEEVALDNLVCGISPIDIDKEYYMFVTCFPCKLCSTSIVNSIFNITKVFYLNNELSDSFISRHCLSESESILSNNNIELIGVNYEY